MAKPLRRVRRNKEEGRDYYASDDDVWVKRSTLTRSFEMMWILAHFTGQRPADTLKVSTGDLAGEFRWLPRAKTAAVQDSLFDGECSQQAGVPRRPV